jgi:hypothetical protein
MGEQVAETFNFARDVIEQWALRRIVRLKSVRPAPRICTGLATAGFLFQKR